MNKKIRMVLAGASIVAVLGFSNLLLSCRSATVEPAVPEPEIETPEVQEPESGEPTEEDFSKNLRLVVYKASSVLLTLMGEAERAGYRRGLAINDDLSLVSSVMSAHTANIRQNQERWLSAVESLKRVIEEDGDGELTDDATIAIAFAYAYLRRLGGEYPSLDEQYHRLVLSFERIRVFQWLYEKMVIPYFVAPRIFSYSEATLAFRSLDYHDKIRCMSGLELYVYSLDSSNDPARSGKLMSLVQEYRLDPECVELINSEFDSILKEYQPFLKLEIPAISPVPPEN